MVTGFKKILQYLNNQSIDIRIRMMFFLEYASLIACFIGTIFMVLLKQPIVSMFPNIILFVMSFISLYFSHIKKKYELSTLIMVIGCANLAVPWMFFTAGGNNSGMPVWCVFSVIVTCMMLNGKLRFIMAAITTVEDIVCMFIGRYFPAYVLPLTGENADFYDFIQSYAVVCVCLTVMLGIYISTYDNQRKKLEEQGVELRNIMQTDALTGVFNRRAYYDEINTYVGKSDCGNLVLVAMDLNGLKNVNDVLGHAAGDEYIRSAAKVITKALGQYGHIFRTGGDEFMAILHCSAEETKSFDAKIKEHIAALDNAWTEKMTIAIGIVCCEDNAGMAISDVEKLADTRMYENKAAYYRNSGIDRRK